MNKCLTRVLTHLDDIKVDMTINITDYSGHTTTGIVELVVPWPSDPSNAVIVKLNTPRAGFSITRGMIEDGKVVEILSSAKVDDNRIKLKDIFRGM